MSEKRENDAYHSQTNGVIDTVEVSIEVEGREDLAEKIMIDLRSRAEELNQIVEAGVHPDAAQANVSVDWESFWREEVDG